MKCVVSNNSIISVSYRMGSYHITTMHQAQMLPPYTGLHVDIVKICFYYAFNTDSAWWASRAVTRVFYFLCGNAIIIVSKQTPNTLTACYRNVG